MPHDVPEQTPRPEDETPSPDETQKKHQRFEVVQEDLTPDQERLKALVDIVLPDKEIKKS